MGSKTEQNELGIIGRAIKEAWDIPAEMKADCIETVHNCINHGSEERVKLKACQIAVSMVGQNVKAQHIQEQAEKRINGPSTQVHVHVTVAQDAFSSFLDDARSTTVIDHVPENAVTPPVNGLRELPQTAEKPEKTVE